MFSALLSGQKTNRPRTYSFQQAHTLEERIRKYETIQKKQSKLCLLIIEGSPEIFSNSQHQIKQYFMLGFQRKLSCRHLLNYLRKSLKINQNVNLCLYIQKKIISLSTTTLGQVQQLYKHEDGFLYIYLEVDNSF